MFSYRKWVIFLILIFFSGVFGFVLLKEFKSSRSGKGEEKKASLQTEDMATSTKVAPLTLLLGEDDTKEYVDAPLPRPDTRYNPQIKSVNFTIEDENENPPFMVNVVLNPHSLEYKATLVGESVFYYTSANGIICYSKADFMQVYCLREKYTPLGAVRNYTNKDAVTPRELVEDEQEVLRMMEELGYVPGNELAAMMIRVEAAIDLLAQGKLKSGAELFYTYENGKKQKLGKIKNFAESSQEENVRISGVHLSKLTLSLIRTDKWEFPTLSFEQDRNDREFINFFTEQKINLNEFLLAQ